MGTALYLGPDSTTQGSWVGVYGSDGYNIIGDSASYPAYATVSVSGNSTYNNGTSTDARALQKASNHSTRISAGWYASAASSFTVDIQLTGGSHKIGFYMWDFDSSNRNIQVQALDQDSGGAVLNTWVFGPCVGITGYGSPVYAFWNCSGHVAFKFSISVVGPNCVMSGIFFDPAASTPASGTASFTASDTTHQGSWIGHYGADGYNVLTDAVSYPAYVTAGPVVESNFDGSSSTNSKFLQQPSSPSNYWDGGWWGWSQVFIDLTFSASKQLSVYIFDKDNAGRAGNVQIMNPATGAVLDTRSFSGTSAAPIYFSWQVSGHIWIVVNSTTGSSSTNALVEGLFFDPGTGSATIVFRRTRSSLGTRAGSRQRTH